MPWPLGASARSSWKHLAWLSEPLGWGSRKQAGWINSQPNEYTKTAATPTSFFRVWALKNTFSVGREWVCERAKYLHFFPTISKRVDVSGESILTAVLIFD